MQVMETDSVAKNFVVKFQNDYPGGFNNASYLSGERKCLWRVHLLWQKTLGRSRFSDLLNKREYTLISTDAVRIISKTNLLTDFEKKVLRDIIKTEGGARLLAIGLYNYLHGQGSKEHHFHTLTRVLETLPHKQVSALTWATQTAFGFIARPLRHLVVNPAAMVQAAEKYAYQINYRHRPNWETYQSVLDFAALVVKSIKTLKPRDMIDLHFFIERISGNDLTDRFPPENIL